jgi:hypothetical protein
MCCMCVLLRVLCVQLLESDVATLAMVEEQLEAFMQDMQRDIK